MVCSCELGTGLTVGTCSCFPSSGVSGTNKGTLDLLAMAESSGRGWGYQLLAPQGKTAPSARTPLPPWGRPDVGVSAARPRLLRSRKDPKRLRVPGQACGYQLLGWAEAWSLPLEPRLGPQLSLVSADSLGPQDLERK